MLQEKPDLIGCMTTVEGKYLLLQNKQVKEQLKERNTAHCSERFIITNVYILLDLLLDCQAPQLRPLRGFDVDLK